jgi:PKD repeat protein/methionine-rich copper-binding protein CopC
MKAKTPVLLVLTLIFALVLCGAVSAGTPLQENQTGTVSGDLYYNASNPWAQTTQGETNEVTQANTLPTYTSIDSARVYVNVYSGSGSNNWPVRTTIKFDGNGDGDYDDPGELLGVEDMNIPGSTDGTVYWLNDHCNRVYSDYQIWYDVKNLITSNHPSIYVKTESIGGDGYDGRIKLLALVAAYNDGDGDVVHYRVLNGQDWINTGSSTSTFNTSSFNGQITNATLNTVALTSTDGTYTFNGNAKTGNLTETGAYYKEHTWDVTNNITPGANSSLIYFNAGSSFKINLATLTIREAPIIPPAADFTATPTTGTTPLIVKFTDTSTGTITGWNWDFNNDGVIDSTLQNPTHTYNEGNYTVSLTVTGPGVTDTITKNNYINVTANPLADSPWPTFGRDLKGTGQSPYNGTAISNLAWKYSTGGAISSDSSATIGADGTIYIGSTDKKLYALNPDGTLKWTFTTGGSVYTPTIGSDGTIYIGSTDKNLYALNPDGTLKWNYTVGGSITGAAKIGTDGTIYVAGGGLYALNPDGTLKWNYSVGSYTPVIGTDGTIYVSGSGALNAINRDGTLKWSYNVNSVDGSPAIGSDGTIYVGSHNYGWGLYAINSDGTLKWRYGIYGQDYITGCSPVIGIDGTIYFGTIGGYTYSSNFFAINPDGSRKWEYTVGLPSYNYIVASAAIGADGTIYVGCTDGKLYTLNNNGTLKWTYTTGSAIRSSPSIGSDGTIYIGSSDGKLYALNIIPPVTNFTADVVLDYAPLTVQFTDTSTENPSAWEWDFNNDGLIDSTSQNPTWTYITPGTYTVKLTASNEKGSNSVIKTDYITVTTPPDDTESPTVTANPTGGYFTDAPQVTLTATDNFDNRPAIYYTTNGTDPTTESTRYTGPLTLSNTTILKFIAADRSGNISPVQTETYTVADTTAPVIDATQDWTTVTLTATDNADPNPTIYYTTDGTEPTTSSTPYSGPFTIPRAAITVVKFIAVDVSGNTSPVQNRTFSTIKTTDLLTRYYTEGHVGVIVDNGGTGYGGGDPTYNLSLPSDAIILLAHLCLSWNWYGYVEYTVNFNGNSIVSPIAHYVDGNDGQDVYDVTQYFNITGNNTATITGGTANYGRTLIVVYQSATEPYRKIWINEGYDIMYPGYGATNGPGYAFFNNVTNSSVISAQLTTTLPSGDNDSPSISMNGQNFSATGRGGSDPAFLYYNVTSALQNGINEIGIEGGSYFSLQNAILVLLMQSDIVADFITDTTTGTAPLTVQFTDQSTDATGWSWDFNNDGVIDSTSQNPTWTYTASDNYTVKLIVTGPGGINEKTKTNYISVVFVPWNDPCESLDGWTTVGGSLNSGTVYQGSSSISGYSGGSPASVERIINITDSSAKTLRFNAAAVTNYSFNNGVRVYLDGQQKFTIPFTGAWNRYTIDLTGIELGNHTFKVDAYSSYSWASATFYLDNIWVIADEEVLSIINITPNEAVMSVGDTIPFSAEARTQYGEKLSSIVYNWSSSNETVGTVDSTGLFTALAGGSTTITAKVNGVTSTVQVNVNYPTPVADFTADETSGDAPLTVQFTDQSTDATGWSWDFNNDGTVDSDEQNPTWTYNTPGTYTVKLTTTGPGGEDGEIKTDYIFVNGPDLVVTGIIPNSGAGNCLFSNGSNVISVTVTNQGTSAAPASTLKVNIAGEDYNVNVPALGVGESATVTVTDTTTRSTGDNVPVNTDTDPNNTIPETNDSNNTLTTTLNVYNNGYRGKRYTDGNDLNTNTIWSGKYNVIYSSGNSAYRSGGTGGSNWNNPYTVNWTGSDLSIPNGANVVLARLYQPYTWNTAGGVPDWTAQFNGKTLYDLTYYTDTKSYGSSNYPSGLLVYDVTSLFQVNGNTLTLTKGANTTASLYGSYLVVIYEDSNTAFKRIYINDGADMLCSNPTYGTNDEQATAYANYNLNTSKLSSAQLVAILASAGDENKSKFFFNGQEYTGFWNDYKGATGEPQTGFSLYDITSSVLNGFNTAALQSYNNGTNGDNMVALGTILVLTTDDQCPTVDCNIQGGLSRTTQTVTLTAADDQCSTPKIYYTLNGEEPTTNCTLYTGPITINSTTKLKFIAVDNAGNTSPVQTEIYTIDNVAPTATVFDPVNGKTNVAAAKTIKVTFSENIKAGSLWIELKNSSKTAIPFTASIDGKVLTIDPISNLAESLYTLCIHTGAVNDLAGNPVALKTSKFSVGTSPTVASIDPVNGATKVAAGKTIKVTFSENIKANSLWIELKNSSGKAVPLTTTVNGKVLTVDPTSNLVESLYTLIIHTGAVTDQAGNPVALKTTKFSVGTPPTINSSDPTNNAANVPRNKAIKVTFNENIKASSSYWIELKDSNGKSVTINKSISGKVLTITHTAKLKANTKYKLTIHTGAVTDTAGNPTTLKTISFTTRST